MGTNVVHTAILALAPTYILYRFFQSMSCQEVCVFGLKLLNYPLVWESLIYAERAGDTFAVGVCYQTSQEAVVKKRKQYNAVEEFIAL